MIALYIIASAVSVVLWTPILVQFLRSWRRRHNPVSLAICAAITLIMWTSVGGIWLVTSKIENHIFLLATVGMSTLAAVYAHIAFYWSKKRFVDQRSMRE